MAYPLDAKTRECVHNLDNWMFWRFHEPGDCNGKDCGFTAVPVRMSWWKQAKDAQKLFRVDSTCSFLRFSVSDLLYYCAPMAHHAVLVYTEQFQPSEMRRLVGSCASIICAYLGTWRLEYPGLIKFLETACRSENVNHTAVAAQIRTGKTPPHFKCPMQFASVLLEEAGIQYLRIRATAMHLEIVMAASDV